MFGLLPSGLGLGKSFIAKYSGYKLWIAFDQSFQGVIMFLLLGAFFHVKSPALREDINVNSEYIFLKTQSFIWF